MRCLYRARGYLFVGLATLQIPLVGQIAEIAEPSSVDRGRLVFVDRERGHCLLCHQIAQLNEPFQGTLGPPLSNVGARLTPDELRVRVVDPTTINPQTVMPAYFRTEGLTQVADEYIGKTLLTAQEIEDTVAFLSSLTHE